MLSELEQLKLELLSTKKALQAEKEDHYSLHEEFYAEKDDLHARLSSLQNAHDDLRNFWDNTPVAMVFLDQNMNITRFTPSVVSIYPLITSDIGRPIKHIESTLIGYDVVKSAQKVLADGVILATEVKGKYNEWYRVGTKPYFSTNNVIDGVVVTFENISELKATQANLITKAEALQKSEQRIRLILEKGEDVFTIIDKTGKYLDYRGPSRFELNEKTTVGKNVSDFFDSEVAEIIMTRIRQVIESGESFVFESEICWKGEDLIFVDHLYPLQDSNGDFVAVGTIGKNVTKERKTIEKLQMQLNTIKAKNKSKINYKR